LRSELASIAHGISRVDLDLMEVRSSECDVMKYSSSLVMSEAHSDAQLAPEVVADFRLPPIPSQATGQICPIHWFLFFEFRQSHHWHQAGDATVDFVMGTQSARASALSKPIVGGLRAVANLLQVVPRLIASNTSPKVRSVVLAGLRAFLLGSSFAVRSFANAEETIVRATDTLESF